jgi:hypothetical protein
MLVDGLIFIDAGNIALLLFVDDIRALGSEQ